MTKYTSVFDMKGKTFDDFMRKYGDIFNPRFVDLEYYKAYYLGKYDETIPIFNYLKQHYNIDSVVYPGSFIHLAPSYAFSNVTYIDKYEHVDDFFEDPDVLKYISLHKIYEEETKMTFINEAYEKQNGQYDLMISSNGGPVSLECFDLLKDGGLLLVNNGHSDADNAFDNEKLTFLGYFNVKGDHKTVEFVTEGKSKKSETYYLFKK
ncbi:hypothetical protein EZV73_19315 [Acidaminobacter sp. JC074]|uniref:hypothetical protein n=1 Tax=Acidaminobacter sp. JC074 TaxID=2530199 RepID=UPI001F0DB24C|nr:hypothetical protein [Acidaminobacter sp. JC074]MCH4889741.1 hypothetical protein [Acidaminobacter sp. JC074]